jgi:uncharacterized protein
MNTIPQWQQHPPQCPQIDRAADLDVLDDGTASSLHVGTAEPVGVNLPQSNRQTTPSTESAHVRHRSRIFGSTVSILLTASLVLLAGIAPSASQERKPTRTLTASGRGVVTIPTTISQIRLAIEVSAKTPTKAQQEAARRSTQVINYLKTQQLEKLQTTGINLNPTYNYPTNGNPQLTGYTATNSISFRVTTDRAGAILDAAVKNGATRIDGVSFVASEQAISTAQIQALKQATQDAQRQADAVLETLNLQRKEVIGIKIDSASNPNPIPLAQEAMKARADANATSTPVVGGEQQVEAAVTLDIGY